MFQLLSLSEAAHLPVEQVGGKARQLGRMLDAGLPVPIGFVVPASSFVAALRVAGLIPRARNVAQTGDAAAASGLREALEGALTETWRKQLVRRARRLGGALAVRSSAIDEDGAERSFAGQHRTELGVAPDDVPDAVLRCWASLYDPAALAYRGGSGPPLGGMAVVIQPMVDVQASGVMFTVNPNNGSWREMVVEAVWGLGEGLVSGAFASHWYLVRRPRRTPAPLARVLGRVSLQVMQQELPVQPEQMVIRDGRVVTEPVPDTRRDQPTLTRSKLLKLCRLGLRVEQLLGEPVDVEWALDSKGRPVLLQARPITAMGSPRPRKDVLWTRRFIGERFPEPPTPLGWSVLHPLLDYFIAYPATQDRYLGGGPALKLVDGRPYVNATVFRHLAFKLPGAPPPRFMLELVPPDEEQQWRRRFAVLPSVDVYLSILAATLAERRWTRFAYNPFTNHQRWEEWRRRLDAALPELRSTPRDLSEALAREAQLVEWMREYTGIHVCSLLFANLFYQLLESGLATWMPEDSVRLRDTLAVCPPGNQTLATNEALYSLSALATDADLQALESGAEPPAGPFRAQLRPFLDAFGHRSEASWDVMAPRWAENPGRLAPLLRAQRQVEEPAVRAIAQQQAANKALAEVRAELGATPRGTLAEMLVRYTQTYLLLRENQRFWFDKLLAAGRQNWLWLGRDLVERGWLDDAEDVAFLTADEVRGLCGGRLDGADARDWVTRRRRQRLRDLQADPPVFLRGDEAPEPPAAQQRLEGLGISPGRYKGVVRILRSVGEGARIQPGDVLVTRTIDPAWTPLLRPAGAVVLEMGSVLSHGAVVAREYGIPGVVNIDGAMRRLVDGQEVTVDGTRGIVWVHP